MKINHTAYRYNFWVTVTVLTVSCVIWLIGFLQSPLFRPEIHQERLLAEKYSKEQAPDYLAEKSLAEAYWQRYPDVIDHFYYGKQGPMGIYGAREHYQQHGKREGRIFAPIIIPDDLDYEKQLAEAYWQRYPDVEKSTIWGRGGSLGILGPRDYHHHYGRHLNHRWGVSTE